MRDSITYNLNYFIMRMSGTRPIKNTVRKSPIRQDKPKAKQSSLRSKEYIVQKSVKEKGLVGEIKKAQVRKTLDAATKTSDATKAKIKAIEEKNNPTKKVTAAERQAKVTELRSKSKEERGAATKATMDKYKADFKAKADKKAGEKNAMEKTKANANKGTKEIASTGPRPMAPGTKPASGVKSATATKPASQTVESDTKSGLMQLKKYKR